MINRLWQLLFLFLFRSVGVRQTAYVAGLAGAIVLVGTASLWAQAPPEVTINDSLQTIIATERWLINAHQVAYQIDNSCDRSVQEAMALPFGPPPPFDSPTTAASCGWFRFTLRNATTQPWEGMLTAKYTATELHWVLNEKLTSARAVAMTLPLTQQDLTRVWTTTHARGFRLSLPPAARATVYVKVRAPSASPYGYERNGDFYLSSAQYVEQAGTRHLLVTGAIQGVFWFVFFFYAVQYFINPLVTYRWYCLWLAGVGVYLVDKEFLLFQGEGQYPAYSAYVFLLAAGSACVSFFQFTRHILRQLLATKPVVDRLLRAFVVFNLVFFSSWLTVYTVYRFVAAPEYLSAVLGLFPAVFRWATVLEFATLIVVSFQLAVRHPARMIRYYVGANFFVLMLLMAYFAYGPLYALMGDEPVGVYRLLGGGNYLVELGFLGQIVLFAISLTYFTREQEKQTEQEFARQVAQTEMRALRLQMNPHFLFNSLNSINRFVLDNQPEKASDYLTKFSRLIRRILQNSKLPTVPLADELEALRLYIDMERLRFENKFAYTMVVHESVEPAYIEVPPLVIQPYVENAIWHGLLHKDEGHGQLSITVNRDDRALYVAVEDNGVGRAAAAALRSRSAIKKKSLGTQITADLLLQLEKMYNVKASARTTDLLDPQGQAAGTRVMLELPLLL